MTDRADRVAKTKVILDEMFTEAALGSGDDTADLVAVLAARLASLTVVVQEAVKFVEIVSAALDGEEPSG